MTPAATRRPVPADVFGGRLAACFLLDLEVATVSDPSDRLRTITFRSSDLVDFAWQPGQDVMFTVPPGPTAGGPTARRRYTIRRADPLAGTLDIDVVLHGDGPFARWAAAVSPGDRIDGIGPRGAIVLRDGATHHVFVGDESAIAVSFAMAEALPAGASSTVVLGVDGPAPDLVPTCAADVAVVWVDIDAIGDALRSLHVPAGAAAYVNGEGSLVRSAADVLAERGVDRDSIATKPYWRRDQPNAPHGEPSKD